MTKNEHDPNSAQQSFGFAGRSPFIWALAFAAAMGAIALLEHRGVLGGWKSLPFVAAAALFLFPMMKAANNRQTASGVMSTAVQRYNRRMLYWSLGYVLCLGTAITIKNYLEPTGLLLWTIAILPSLPMAYFVWVLGRYIVEEDDEYLRLRSINAGLIGLGFVLIFGGFWGFLETFKVVPHIDAWWVVPVWAIGLGVGQIFLSLRDKREGGA